MPWKVEKGHGCPAGKPFAVIKETTGKVVGCHDSRGSANKQMAALYASEGEPMPTSYQLHDEFDLSEVFEAQEIDGRMTANVRILKAGKSKNNRTYRESALREAVDKGLFNGVRMFLNHSDTPPLKRSITDMVSAIESTTFNEADKAIDARVEFFKKDFFEYVQRAHKYMGDSINSLVQGTRTKSPSGVVEEDIHRIVQPRSVDWVIYPAAGGQVLAFESETGDEEVDWTSITYEDLKANAPTLIDEIKAEIKKEDTTPPQTPPTPPVDVEEVVKKAIAAHEAERQLIAQKQKAAADQVREALSKAGLPERTRARVAMAFEGVEEVDKTKLDLLVTEAKEELAAAGAGPKITGQGRSTTGEGDSSKPVFSVKENVEGFFGSTKKTAKKEGDN